MTQNFVEIVLNRFFINMTTSKFAIAIEISLSAEPALICSITSQLTLISRDFEAYPKNMGHLIAADSLHQIFCSKKIDPLPFLKAVVSARARHGKVLTLDLTILTILV